MNDTQCNIDKTDDFCGIRGKCFLHRCIYGKPCKLDEICNEEEKRCEKREEPELEPEPESEPKSEPDTKSKQKILLIASTSSEKIEVETSTPATEPAPSSLPGIIVISVFGAIIVLIGIGAIYMVCSRT